MKNTEINHIQIEAENLGGFTGKTRLEMKPGINIIEAPNAVGKTSIVGAFALSVLPPKEALQHAHILHSAETHGRVKLSFDNQKVERTIQRKGKDIEIAGGSVASGDELGLLRRYAVADEYNPVLVKIRAGDNLKEVLTEYSGIEELRSDQKKLLGEKSELQERLKQGQEKIKRLDTLRKDLKGKEKKLEELEAKKKKIREKKPEAEETRLVELEGEIAGTEADLKNLAESVKLAESSIKSRKERLKAIEQRASGGTEDIVKEIKEKDDETEALEKDKLELERNYSLKSSELSHLRFIVSSAPAFAVPGEGKSEDKLAALISDEEQVIICPVCEHKTKYGQIKAKLQKTDEEVKEISKQKSELEEKISKLNRKISELNTKKAEKDAMGTEKERILHELSGHEKLFSRKNDDIKTLENKLGELRASREKQIKKRKEEASETEKERIELEREIAVISSGIDRLKNELRLLESAASDLGKIEIKYENVEQKIKELTSEIEERENGIVRIFNTEIKKIYDKMGFKKVDELRLDKKFDLNVVRKSKAGAGYTDIHSVKSLSKTEREVAGLILLLSGYRAFKVAEKYPLFIIDEISFMDPKRLEAFIDHIKETAKAIVLTTIPGREIELPGVTHIPLAEARS